jgi:beta-glucosidase-like glycosyl hydrolase
MVVALRVQRTGEEVWAVVMRELLLVGQIPIAGVEALRQEQERTDAVAVGSKIGRVALLMEGQPIVRGDGLPLLKEEVVELVRQGHRIEPADVTHDQEHGVLHRRVGNATEIPQPLGQQNVHETSHEAHFHLYHLLTVFGGQRGQQ